MIEIKLNSEHFEEIIKKGYSLDIIFLLKLYNETDEGLTSSPKINNIIQTSQRKGLLTENEELTDVGKELIMFLSSQETHPKFKRIKKEANVEDFDKWWKTYPGTDSFEYKGKTFKGTRALRVKKNDCKIKIEKILKSGEYTIDELIAALELEVNQKVENSIKTGQNKMSYMQNSLTYLNQCTYEPFIELVRKGYKVKENKKEFDGVNI